MLISAFWFYLREDESQWRQLFLSIIYPDRWFPVGKLKQIKTDKLRNIVKQGPVDRSIARALVKKILRINANFLPCVHSYISGKDQMTSLRSLQKYLRAYRKKTPKHNRNLCVLRFDIEQCGENIYVGEPSFLWKRFKQFGVTEYEMKMLKRVLRPEIIDGDKNYSMLRGTPTGSPAQPLALNTYLSLLDEEISHLIGEGHYLRYGDDILIIHPDELHFNMLHEKLEQKLNELHLRSNNKKRHTYQLNGAARKVIFSLAARDNIEYLGMRVYFRGGIALNQVKTNSFLKDFARTCRRMKTINPNQRFKTSKIALNQFLSRRNYLGHEYLEMIFQKVDDRPWIKDTNYKMRVQLNNIFAHSHSNPTRGGWFHWKRMELPYFGKKNK